MRLFIFLIAFFAAFTCNARAESGAISGWLNNLKSDITTVYNDGRYELFVPVRVWHNRLAYDKKKVKKYNEEPWGAGFGKYYYDEDGNWHALYAMAFKDSNFHLETMFGYGYLHNWRYGESKDWRLGLGYTLGFTQRSEYKYIPIPLPLPIAGFGYKNFNVQAAYVPGIKNDGNVLFTWLTIEF